MEKEEYRLVRFQNGDTEIHLVTFRDSTPIKSRKAPLLPLTQKPEWDRYQKETRGGSIAIDQIHE